MRTFLSVIILSIFTLTVSAQKVRIYKYNKKFFSKNNYFYRYDDKGGAKGVGQLTIIKPDRGFWGSLKEDGSINVITPDSKDEKRNGTITWTVIESIDLPKSPTGSKENHIDDIYFPESIYPALAINDLAKSPVDRKIKSLKYRDYKFVLQAMSVPLKFRKAIDTIPYSTETGVNIAFGAGLKWSYYWQPATKSFLGQKTNSLSFTPGVLCGFGATDIKSKVTASASFKDRKEPIFSFGGFFMIGFNNINIGFVIGRDLALKDGRKAGGWIYNAKTWTGISIGLDLIK